MSNFTAAIRAIHALAALRNPDTDATRIGVVLQPHFAEYQTPAPLGAEVSEWCSWEASIRLGSGKWDGLHGMGATPDVALDLLLASLQLAHGAMDERRASLMGRLQASFAAERDCITVKDTGAALPEKGFAEFVAPSKPPRALSAEERAGLRIGQGDLLDELMEQAQHHDSGGQTWEMLKAKRRELGLPDFVLANERAPTK